MRRFSLHEQPFKTHKVREHTHNILSLIITVFTYYPTANTCIHVAVDGHPRGSAVRVDGVQPAIVGSIAEDVCTVGRPKSSIGGRDCSSGCDCSSCRDCSSGCDCSSCRNCSSSCRNCNKITSQLYNKEDERTTNWANT